MTKEKIIFVVDKSESHSRLLSQFFPGGLYKVFNFMDCNECIRNLSMSPDMVMLDMDSMSQDTGQSLTSTIRKANRRIPVVLI